MGSPLPQYTHAVRSVQPKDPDRKTLMDDGLTQNRG